MDMEHDVGDLPDNDESVILSSIVSRIDGFVYRCRNDSDYTPIFVSESVRDFLGYEQGQFFPSGALSIASITSPDSLDELTDVVNVALSRRTSWTHDYMMVSANGEPKWVNECGGGIFDNDGNLLYLEGIVLGIGDRKLIENANKVMTRAVADNSHDIISNTQAIFDLLKKLRLLALNARIEAARAGSFGAGFTVVAQEIGDMAKRTGNLASRISQSTDALQTALKTHETAL